MILLYENEIWSPVQYFTDLVDIMDYVKLKRGR